MKIIPELRFPDFKNEGEWSFEELEQCLDYLQPTPYLVESTDYKDEYETPVLTAGKTFILGYTNEKEGVFRENLPVIIFDDFTTASQFVDFPFKTKSSAMKILLAKNGNNIKFIYEAIQNIKYEVGVHQRHWISIYSKLKIAIPKNPKEQQKIASCFSSLDELIAAHNDKLDALKDHKKGLLQNLFPQEGETVPKVRFPEFEDDGEWVETTLEEVADYENGKAHEKNIDENGDYIVVNSKFISSEGETVKYSNTAFCPASEGDILMVLSDIPNGKAIAKCFYVDEDDKYSVNQRICRITATNCDSRFLFYIMDRNAYFLSFDDGVKQTNLRKSDVLEFPFRIPTDPVEQTKIASCITAVDDLIKSQSAKIEELNQHKRGLMQGLFPKIKS